MAESTQNTRRTVLKAAGTVGLLGIAGCVSQSNEGGDGSAGSTDGSTDQTAGDHDDEDSHDDDHNDGDDHEEEDGHDDTHEEAGDHEEEGDNGHNHDEGAPEGPSHAADVTMETSGTEQHFAPHVVWVEPGGTVTWTLESGSHDVVAYHPDNDKPERMPADADSFSSDLLGEEGATFEHTFDVEGVYDYYCTPHEAVGMVGTVIVGEPDPHGQLALEEPQETLPDGARSQLADLGGIVSEALGDSH
jgi:plastocyanin